MKRIGLLTLALLLTPALAAAQPVPPGAPAPADSAATAAGPTAGQLAAHRQMRDQMVKLHQQARYAMLAALSPQHRTLVASVVGQLAIASTPDPQAAARQLDAALTTGEKQAIVNIGTATHTSAHKMMEEGRAQMEASLTPEQRTALVGRHSMMQGEAARPHTLDPGAVLLRMIGTMDGPGAMHGEAPHRD